MKIYRIDRGCKFCFACKWACPAGAIIIVNELMEIDQSKCARCGICYDNCANEAISITEMEVTNDPA